MNKVKCEHVWFKGIMGKVCSQVCTHIHMYDDLVNTGALERCAQEYLKVDICLYMLCPSERFFHLI